ncbi:hypothetical protein CapIbe_007972 [Capra ibex]
MEIFTYTIVLVLRLASRDVCMAFGKWKEMAEQMLVWQTQQNSLQENRQDLTYQLGGLEVKLDRYTEKDL